MERAEYENEQLRKQLEKATSDLSLPENVAVERRIANRDFRIHDLLKLAGTDSTIEGKEFENCTIRGPATITTAAPPRPPEKKRGSMAQGEVWHLPTLYVEGDPDSVLQEVPSGGATASGVIHLVGCSYKRVTFSGIGIVGNADELDWWRENATFSRGSASPQRKQREDELQALRASEKARHDSLEFYRLLNDRYEEGARRREHDYGFRPVHYWEKGTNELIIAALGIEKMREMLHRNFLDEDPDYARYGEDVSEGDSEAQIRMALLLHRLRSLMINVNSLTNSPKLREDFDPQPWKERFNLG